MNQRIIELADKAGLKVNADGEIGPAYFGSVDAGYRKFAELIVRDVVKTVKRTQNTSPDFEWVILNNYDLEIEE